MEGVREDVVDIVLNIKQLALRMHSEGPKRMTPEARKAPARSPPARSKRHPTSRSSTRITSLLTLDEGASVRIEFTVQNGKGYVAAERNRPEDAPIGLIAVDALYSPVKRVAYRVEPTRQGQSARLRQAGAGGRNQRRGDSPVDAVAYAARILQDQLATVHHLRRTEEEGPKVKPNRNCRSIRPCSRRSTNWSFRFAPPTA